MPEHINSTNHCSSYAQNCQGGCCDVHGQCPYYSKKPCHYYYNSSQKNTIGRSLLNTYNLRLERPFDDSVWIIFYVLGGFLIFMAATIIFTLACREKRLAHAPSFNAQQSIINTLRSVQTPMGYPSGIPPPFPQVYHPSGRVSVNTGLPVNANNLFPTPITRT